MNWTKDPPYGAILACIGGLALLAITCCYLVVIFRR